METLAKSNEYEKLVADWRYNNHAAILFFPAISKSAVDSAGNVAHYHTQTLPTNMESYHGLD
jgi:hypothetical protein